MDTREAATASLGISAIGWAVRLILVVSPTGANCLHHTDFLNDPDGRHYNWQLTDWSSAVRIVLGGRALLFFRGAFAALLAPTTVLTVYSLYSNRPGLLVLVFLSFWGFWTSRTGPTGIGMAASILVALVGSARGMMLHDGLLFFSAMLPGVTWFGSCAILGTTASYMTDALRKSEAPFQVLVSRGVLKATAVAEPQSHAPEPAAGPDSSRKSSPQAR